MFYDAQIASTRIAMIICPFKFNVLGNDYMQATYKVVALISGVILMVSLGVAMSFWSFRQIQDAADARKHYSQITNSANQLLSDLKDAETGQRGYLLTDDEKYLEPYLQASSGIRDRLTALKSITANKLAHQHLDTMASLIDAKISELSQTVDLRRSHDMESALAIVKDGQGKHLMDLIRVEMSSFMQVEDDDRKQIEEAFENNMRRMFVLIVISSLLTLLFALSFVYFIYRGTQQKLKNLVHLETKHLLEIQEEMNKQLQQANATLQVSEEKLAVTLYSIGDAVLSTDSEGCVTLLNPLAEKLTGWTLAQAAGRPIDEIFKIINQDTRLPACHVIPT